MLLFLEATLQFCRISKMGQLQKILLLILVSLQQQIMIRQMRNFTEKKKSMVDWKYKANKRFGQVRFCNSLI